MNRKRIIPWLAVSVFLLAGITSCIKDEVAQADCSDQGPAEVRLMVRDAAQSRAGSTSTDNEVRQLRIYAFNQSGERVGYAYVEDMPEGTAYVPMYLSQSGSINFYVIANDKYATSTTVADWENLKKTDFSTLDFTGWQEVDGKTISPMVNDLAGSAGVYSTPIQIGTGSATVWQVVDVTVQHVLARLRLLLKKEGNGDIVINRAAVYHQPDNYMLLTPTTVNVVTFEKNADDVSDEFVKENVPVTATGTSYQEIGHTFLKPNAYGSSDPDTYSPVYPSQASGTDHLDKAYILRIDYTIGSEQKQKEVYLPQVRRNQSIDVQGTLKSGSLSLEVTVNDWGDGGSFDMSYNDEFDGTLTLVSSSPVVGDDEKEAAYPVVYGDAASTRHDLILSLDIKKPIGASWAANLSDGNNFVVLNEDGTPFAGGTVNGEPITIIVRPTNSYEPGEIRETELYITLIRNEQNQGEQIINQESVHPGTNTRIKIRQIAYSDWPSQP